MPDIECYRHHFAGSALTETQQAEVIRSLHLVMESFVDLAFGMDATQISLGISDDLNGVVGPDRLDSNPSLPLTFNDAAAGVAAGKTDS